MRVKIEWIESGGPRDPRANLVLGDENVGRMYHEGISWTIVVKGQRRGGYASMAQVCRDAKRLWERTR